MTKKYITRRKITAVSGCLNKVFAFDKGITFLVIFGLPGFKHKNEVAHALQCADAISQELLKEVNGIRKVSIGVTTGQFREAGCAVVYFGLCVRVETAYLS